LTFSTDEAAVNPSAVTTTETVDAVFLLIFGISALMLVGITATIIFFLVKYNRRRNPSPLPSPNYNIPLETAWTILPTIIVLAMFWYGWSGYTTLRNVPADALPVKVVGRQWSWSFEYANGRTSDRLFVPAGRPVRLELTSADVLHNFYMPAFRVKVDAVPGMTTHLWFLAQEPGSYDAFCAEYCGVAHSAMITTVEAMTEHEFEEWYRGETAEEEAAEGERLLEKYGCLGCHSLDGSRSVGPTFLGLYGRQTTVVTDGRERTLTVDDGYIEKSIRQPQADLVEGYPPVMPTYEGKIPEHDLEEIIEYFRKTGSGTAAKKSGKELLEEKGCLGCHSTDGSTKVGPTLKGLFGRQVTVEKGGETLSLTADAEYLLESIRHPKAAIVKGYPPVMPDFADLPEEELDAIVDFLKELR
jgi:cytochrome c oxidase subunit 2